MQNLRLAFSPCPNDTFIFDGLVNRRFDHPFSTEVEFHDVEVLNQMAEESTADVIKVSIAQVPAVSAQYQVLSCGAALGFGCGPLLVTRAGFPHADLDIETLVYIPGERTTANLLLSTFYPQLKRKESCLFSDVGERIMAHPGTCGLLIHEKRFTYNKDGLVKLSDLGALWESRFGMPVPLGCILIRRSLDHKTKVAFQESLRHSVEMALANPDISSGFVAAHANDMDPVVQRSHIELYVNRYSIDLGEEGKSAIRQLYRVGISSGILSLPTEPLFLDDETLKS
jgi:1,4-dihydroxy-6-naphthoate synthase